MPRAYVASTMNAMCKQITCETCGRPTWTGCGQHIEDALFDVPVAERCPGHEELVSA